MIDARRYTPTNTRFFTWILRHTFGAFAAARYRCGSVGTELFRELKPPFIVVGNHSTLLDPFLSNYFVPHPIHWVASDGNMRNPIMRFLLIKLVGSIPKSKAIPDIETVNWIVRIIRKQKGVVGFFPEGQTTWDGRSLPSFSATAKLIKLLKVPVVCALSSGAYMIKPRWAYNRRRGSMLITFSSLFEPAELAKLSVPEIDERLAGAIRHDDPAWAQTQGLRYEDARRAEKLELALYACPGCGGLATIGSAGTEVICSSCGFTAGYGPSGEITASRDSPELHSVSDWDAWQAGYLHDQVRTRFLSDPDEVIFSDEHAILLKGKRMDTMQRLGRGRIALSASRLYFSVGGREVASFGVDDIEGPGVLKWNFFEFYVGKDVYRVRFRNRAASGRKYAVALETIARVKSQLAAGAR